MHNIHCCSFKGPASFEEGNADHVNTETDMTPAYLYSQGHTEWEETMGHNLGRSSTFCSWTGIPW